MPGALGGRGVDLTDLRLLGPGAAGPDRDLPGLEGLRNLADEVDMQKAVLEDRTAYLDVVGKLEAPLEGAPGNAAVENLATLGVLGPVALHVQDAFLCLDGKVLVREAGDGEGDAVGILTGPLDVLGRIGVAILRPRELVEQREDAVEADGRAIERAEIESSHLMSSLERR